MNALCPIVTFCVNLAQVCTPIIISIYNSYLVMTQKAIHLGMFLLTGIVLAVAGMYTFPMQQVEACGKSCNSGDKNGGSCCGSLVNVQGNNVGNVKTGDVKVGNVKTGDVKVGNVKTGDVLSGNNIKILSNNDNNKIGNLNDVNVLSKNYVKDVNVLSKNNNMKVSNIASDNLNDITVKSNDVIEDGSFNDNIQVAFSKLLSGGKGCGC